MNSQGGRGTKRLMATLKKIPTIMGHGVKEKIILTLFFFFFSELQVKFYLGQMRIAAWETASRIAPRNCSKEAGGKGEYIYDFC